MIVTKRSDRCHCIFLVLILFCFHPRKLAQSFRRQSTKAIAQQHQSSLIESKEHSTNSASNSNSFTSTNISQSLTKAWGYFSKSVTTNRGTENMQMRYTELKHAASVSKSTERSDSIDDVSSEIQESTEKYCKNSAQVHPNVEDNEVDETEAQEDDDDDGDVDDIFRLLDTGQQSEGRAENQRICKPFVIDPGRLV